MTSTLTKNLLNTAICVFLLKTSATAQNTIYTWKNAQTFGDFTDSDNWIGGLVPPINGAPGSGSTEIRMGYANASDINLSGSILLHTLKFTSDYWNNHPSFSVTNGMTLNHRIENGANSNMTVYSEVTLNGGSHMFWAHLGNLRFPDPIDLNSRDLELRADYPASVSKTITLTGGISGGYLPQYGGTGITKTGDGVVLLGGSNSYTAPFTVTDGELRLISNSALPIGSSLLTVGPLGSVTVDDGVDIPLYRDLELKGTLKFNGTSSWSFADELNITGDSAKIIADGPMGRLKGNMLYPMSITGGKINFAATAGSVLDVAKVVEIDPNGAAFKLTIGSYPSTADSGTVLFSTDFIQKAASSGSLDSITLLSGTLKTTNQSAAAAKLDGFNNFILGINGTVDVDKKPITVRNLQGSGTVEMGLDGSLTSILSPGVKNFTGEINGSSSSSQPSEFRIEGAGTMATSGTITTGKVTVGGTATLQLYGASIAGGALRRTTVEAGGTLAGTGTMGNVTLHGTINPGDPNAGSGDATQLITQQLILEDGSTIIFAPTALVAAAGTSASQLESVQVNCSASSANPITIKVNVDALTGFGDEDYSFLLVDGSVASFSTAEFEIVDESSSSLAGEWSIETGSSPAGLVLKYTAPITYETWISGYNYSGADALETADPDQDGLPNMIEFVIGSSPVSDDQTDRPSIDIIENGGSQFVRFTYRQTDDSSYLSVGAEYSVDLVSWNPLSGVTGYYQTIDPVSGETGVTLHHEHIPYDPVNTPKLFLRLGVAVE